MFDDRAKFDLWCSLEDDTDKQNFLQFGELSPRALSLICGVSVHLYAERDPLLLIYRFPL